MPLEALRPLALAWIFGMTVVLAWLWYRGKITRTLAVVVLLVSALFGFLFAAVAPYLFQLLLLGNLGEALTFTVVILGLLFLLTLVFGRIFCGSLCPLGALQELASLAPVPKVRYREKRILYAVRFIVLGIIIAAAVLLSVNVLGYLGVLDLFLLTLSLGTAVMLTILVISLFFYRPFCRALCPYGAVLSLGALASPFKLRRNPSCIECGKCEFACPVDEAKRGDLKGECYLCGRCREVCPVKGTITYRRGRDSMGRQPGDPEAVAAAGGGE